MPNTITKDLGPVSGYAIAVENGYTGTEEEWIAEVLRGTQNAKTATQKAAEAAASESAAAGSADDASDSADSAKADALKAEGNAVGKQNDVDVVDGPYYHNNAKYYAEQAEASKRAAASSETAAGTAAAAAQEWATGQDDPTAEPGETNNAAYYAAQAAESATAAAGSAASGIAALANEAPTFDTSTAYTAGEYVLYNSVLYRFTADHAAGAWTGTDAVTVKIGGEVSDLKTQFDEKINSKYGVVNPVNWFDNANITSGVLYKNGTTEANAQRCYTDFIPVSEGDKVRQYYGSSNMPTIYRRNVCCYDSSKEVVSSAGTDSASSTAFTVPSGIAYIRMTIDSTYSDKAMITKNLIPTAYSQYFEPHSYIASDFLTQESEDALSSYKNSSSAYGFAMPHGTTIRQTVGLDEEWYNYSMVTPASLTPNVSIGAAYMRRKNDGVYFPNDTDLSSSNGYSAYVYDQNFIQVFGFNGSGTGAPRRIITENLANCSAIVIGDSIIDFDILTMDLLNYFTSKSKTLTLLGTLGSGLNKNEGRSGWKATDYLTDKTYEGVINPFYNPTSATFDFSYYMTNQGYSAPDFVVLHLGTNDLYNSGISAIEPTWNAIKTIIDSILSYNSSIKIILDLVTSPNSNQDKHSVFLPSYQNRVVRYNQYALEHVSSTYQSTNVRVSYSHLVLDPTSDINDHVHPTNAGFEKLAKEIINQINCWQNGV